MDRRLHRIADYFLTRERSADVNPTDIHPSLLRHIFVLEIARGATRNELLLRIRLTGTAIDQAFGRSLLGHSLTDFVHGPRTGEVIKGFHR